MVSSGRQCAQRSFTFLVGRGGIRRDLVENRARAVGKGRDYEKARGFYFDRIIGCDCGDCAADGDLAAGSEQGQGPGSGGGRINAMSCRAVFLSVASAFPPSGCTAFARSRLNVLAIRGRTPISTLLFHVAGPQLSDDGRSPVHASWWPSRIRLRHREKPERI